MKNLIKKFIVLGAFAFFALAGLQSASAYVSFSPQPGYSKITRISNCDDCYTWSTSSVSVDPGEEVTVDVTVYNTGDTTATGVRVKITPEDTAALLTHTRSGQVLYTGGSTSITSVNANVTGGLAQTLEYVPGSFRYYPPECTDPEIGIAGCTVSTVPPFGGSQYDLFAGGVSVGSVIADDYPAHVQARFRVGTATPVVYECSDGINNDGDDYTDYPGDPDCTSATDLENVYNAAPTYTCSDGADNEGDGYTDYPSDPDCTSSTDSENVDNSPTDSYECSDGYDNDGDGDTDMYDDGCTSATDDSEDSDGGDDDIDVTTEDAENIEEEEAELVGSIDNNDDNQDLEVYFYISDDQDDDNEDDLIDNGDKEMADDNFDDDNGEFSEVVDNLDPDTEYFFIACFEDEDGDETCDDVESFTTDDENEEEEEDPIDTPAYTTPTVITTVVTQVTGATARLNGLLSSDGNTAATAWFEWGTSNGLGFRTADQYLGIGDGKAFGNDIFGLSANTTYYFRACARNTGGTQCGNVLNFRTVSTNNPITPVFTGPTVTTVGTGGGGTSRLMLEITSPYENACPADINDYTVTYKNISGRTLTNVILRVTLPADVMFRKSSAGDYTESDKTLTVELDELATNEEGEIFISGEVMRGVSDEDIMVATAVMAYTYSTTLGQEDAIAYKIHDVTRCGGSSLAGFALFGNGFFPDTFGGWLILLLLIAILVAVGRSIARRSVVAPVAVTHAAPHTAPYQARSVHDLPH